jgi:sialate O-acetylesterase
MRHSSQLSSFITYNIPVAMRSFIIFSALVLQALPSFAEVSLPKFFGDHMVLQRDAEVAVWGWAAPREEVRVSFGGQTRTTRAGEGGDWMVRLDPMAASHAGRTLTVNDSVTFENVLVGDLWLCSGQSNMEWTLRGALNAREEIAAADYPSIRHIKIERRSGDQPRKDVHKVKGWDVCRPDKAGEFTAVGYFFARRLYEELNVPIGIVNSSWGGTAIEPWTAPEGFYRVPELASIAARVKAADPATEEGQQAHRKALEEVSRWLPQARAAVESGERPAPMPAMPVVGTGGRVPTSLYNEMIHPLTPMTIKGVIWYQGESNEADGMAYLPKMRALIEGWREVWSHQGQLPFYFVQLASFKNSPDAPAGGDGWAPLREAQRKALELDHTGMAVAIDVGEAGDIHPKNKQDVGRRLARWALADAYEKDIVPGGPLFESISIHGDRIHVHFNHVGPGLMVGRKEGLEPAREIPGGRLGEFAIAGEDKVWHRADATIQGDTVEVFHKDVPKPVAVRYAYRMNPVGANLYNKEGLPASPCRSDEW